MPAVDTSTPVVVLSAKTHGSLGILRSLGRLGVAVYAVDSDPRGPASYSRYCRGRFVWDFTPEAPRASLAGLLRIGEQIGRRSLLIPTWDETALFVADCFDELKQWFIYPQQPEGLPRALANKKGMYFLAHRHGVPAPEAAFPASRAEVQSFAATAQFPVMLKGIDGNRLNRRTGKKMVVVQSAAELLEQFDRLDEPGYPNLMLQEYIPGGDDCVWMFNGYFNENSDCVAGFTGRKLRQYPVYTGATSLGICTANPEVEATTLRWMKALGYRGVLDIGYRFDRRDGQYKVLDANPRIGATFRLFLAQNGMDVARALYLDLTQQPLPPVVPCEGRKWMVEQDFGSCIRYLRDGKLKLSDWVKSFGGVREAGYFALDDMRPFWHLCRALLPRMRGGKADI